MKVVHLSTADFGGAGRAAYRLHAGLLRLGCTSSMFVALRQTSDPTVKAFMAPSDTGSRVRRYLRQSSKAWRRYRQQSAFAHNERLSDHRAPEFASVLAQLPDHDVINLHLVADFVDYAAFFENVADRAPVVWTLHDMNPFTGGCHYTWDCTKFTEQCGGCPQLGSTQASDWSHQVWARKRRIFSKVRPDRLHIVAPSHWLADQASRSSLFKSFQVHWIPYGLDTEVFQPRDKALARSALGVQQDASVVLFSADSIGVERKGWGSLVRAIASLRELPRPLLLSVGSGQPETELPVPCLSLGRIENDRILSLAYSASDLFVIPSSQDNLPNTVMEAMACGTPTVGFSVGGIPDMVRQDITGALVPSGDAAVLGSTLVSLLRADERRSAMAANCRRIALDEYGLEVQAKRYLKLYEELVGGSAKAACNSAFSTAAS